MSDRVEKLIQESNLLSRDLSWIQFNYRVLDQAKKKERNLFEKLKFLSITASNLDEFFMIRVGSLYNYLDYGKERVDYSGLKSTLFKEKLYQECGRFNDEQHKLFLYELMPQFEKTGFRISLVENLNASELKKVSKYFNKTVSPMLTPMVFDNTHSFPMLNNQVLIFGVETKTPVSNEKRKVSFVQIPKNLNRFYQIERAGLVFFVPIESIIETFLDSLFKNVEIISKSLFRVTRNGDFTLDESEDIEDNFLNEVRKKLKTRKSGRVVRLEVEEGFSSWLLKKLFKQLEIDESNVATVPKKSMMDFSALKEIFSNKQFDIFDRPPRASVLPISMRGDEEKDIFQILKDRDVMLHHPYNSMSPLLDLIERAAEDSGVLSIKLTIYRLAKNSRITAALMDAVENGKHVTVLFEVRARFDEENNMREAKKLQKAGCFVVYGVGNFKTHTKLLLIVRKEKNEIRRYVHMSSGNYNEVTSKLYTDLGYLTSDAAYAKDVQDFFNVITGHSLQDSFETLITAPNMMRTQLIEMIKQEKKNKLEGKEAGIIIKINSLQDKDFILSLYDASQSGVCIKLIVRGMCCLRPGRKGLSENIEVRSIVGEYLEHSRIYYFHHAGKPRVYSGSADIMVRSFERRVESLFEIRDPLLKKQAINILDYNMKDNVNSYILNEEGSYHPISPADSEKINVHDRFFDIQLDEVKNVGNLFGVSGTNKKQPDFYVRT